jgi:AraC family transcriptional regulator
MAVETGAEIHAYPAFHRMPRHAHDQASVSFVLRGSLVERVGHDEQFGSVGSIVAKAADLDHANEIGPRGALMMCLRPIYSLSDLCFQQWQWSHGSAASRVTFASVPELLSGDRFGVVEERLMRVLAHPSSLENGLDRQVGKRSVSELRDWIHANPASRPSICTLARRYGVHPVHLSRAFKQAFGRSVTFYARRVRVLAVASRIAQTDDRIAVLAQEFGLADQSHLNRNFRLELGISPGRYRSLIETLTCSRGSLYPD